MNSELSTLIEAFNAGKKDRQVLSKQIIWESGVSKSQFYRILGGAERPSPETKRKICESLNIDEAEFDRLHTQSKAEPTAGSTSQKNSWTKPLLFLFSVLLIGAVGFTIVSLLGEGEPAVANDVSSPDDSTLFIMDVTIPDGTSIPVDTTFVKTWRVKNIGKVTWKNRYLKRVTPASPLICSSPAMVPIPETAPGETVDISVTFTTPHLPGSCRTDWKSSDENGNLHFPDMHGLFSIVTVTK